MRIGYQGEPGAFSEAAARRGAQATVRASQFRQLAMMDQVAREVAEAYSQKAS